jgi:hypothetical protein
LREEHLSYLKEETQYLPQGVRRNTEHLKKRYLYFFRWEENQ